MQPKHKVVDSKFYSRLRSMLSALEKLEQRLPPDQWGPFIRDYSRHWMRSLEYREEAVRPDTFYNEWVQIQALTPIAMATDSFYRESRRYGVYESPKERARRVLAIAD